jgi:hypothetical protein
VASFWDRRAILLKLLDIVIEILFWIALLALSLLVLVQAFRGKLKGYGLAGILPDSWRRWILDEKKPNS